MDYQYFKYWICQIFNQYKYLSFVAELEKPKLFGVASIGGPCGDRGSEYPDLFSDVRIPDVSDWIKNVTEIQSHITTAKNMCEKLEIYFGGNPFGVNGFYNLKIIGNRKEWVRDGFRIHSDYFKRRWIIRPDGQRGKFVVAPRTSDCPSGYW